MRHFHEVAGRHQINVPLKTWIAMGYALDADQAEVEGVVGLICALETWHRWWADRWGFRRGLEVGAEVRNIVVPFSRSFNAEVEGVVGLIATIYAWRCHRQSTGSEYCEPTPCPGCGCTPGHLPSCPRYR